MNAPRLYTTERPGVMLAESRNPSVLYVLWNCGTPFVRCTCPRALREQECRHVAAAKEMEVTS